MKLMKLAALSFAGITFFVNTAAVLAAETLNTLNGVATNTGVNMRDFFAILATIVQFALGLTGIIAFIMFFVAGYQYLTAAGNKQILDDAKNRMTYAITGMVIIALAWVFAAYLVGASGIRGGTSFRVIPVYAQNLGARCGAGFPQCAEPLCCNLETNTCGYPSDPQSQLRCFGDKTGANTRNTLPVVVGTIIKFAIGIVGIIAFIMFIAGGYQYLTSGGNKEGLDSAKARMTYAVAGLVIIAVAWVITAYIVGLTISTR
ncbi:MAG: hypothetical protein HY459_03995 [Parcubacteria group bacterium]|nr:hypothetical protein [Parcubacteria group bacterium]